MTSTTRTDGGIGLGREERCRERSRHQVSRGACRFRGDGDETARHSLSMAGRLRWPSAPPQVRSSTDLDAGGDGHLRRSPGLWCRLERPGPGRPSLCRLRTPSCPLKSTACRCRIPFRNFEQSPLFDAHLPPDNIFGVGEDVIPELRLSPSVDEGFYLFVRPQPPGEHTTRWRASWVCPFPPFHFEENVTYHLTVSTGAAR